MFMLYPNSYTEEGIKDPDWQTVESTMRQRRATAGVAHQRRPPVAYQQAQPGARRQCVRKTAASHLCARRSTTPGSAPVCSPSATTITPFTHT